MAEQILISAITCVISIALGWVASSLKQVKQKRTADCEKDDEWKQSMTQGMRDLLRNELVRVHQEYVVQQGSCPLIAKEIAERTYLSYHALEGNGTGTSLFRDIMELPIKED